MKTTTEWLELVKQEAILTNKQGKSLYDLMNKKYNVPQEDGYYLYDSDLDLAIWIQLSNKTDMKLPNDFFN